MVKLKKNGWHFRLQKYVVGRAEHRANLCPYFWITVFCLLVVVPVFIGRQIGKLLVMTVDRLTNTLDDLMFKPMFSWYISQAPGEQVEKFWDFSAEKGSYYRSYYDERFCVWKDVVTKRGLDWRKELDAIIERNKKARQEEVKYRFRQDQLRRERKKAVDKTMMNIGKWLAPPVFVVIGSGIIGFIGWLCWRGYVVAGMHWEQIIIGVKYTGILIGIVIATATVLVAFGAGLVRLWRKCDFRWMRPMADGVSAAVRLILTPFRPVGDLFGAIGVKVRSLFLGVGEFVDFFTEYAKAWKQNHCPNITWE